MSLLIIGVTASARAQTVRGAVRDQATGAPVPGAVVSLLDASGTRQAGAFADDSGRFALLAPAVGTYTLSAQRIGYQRATTQPLVVRAGETISDTLQMGMIATSLGAVTVSGDGRCQVREGDGTGAAELWERVSATLDATALTQAQGLLRTTVAMFERDETLTGSVTSERRWTRSGVAEAPFTSVPPDTLARYGYARARRDGTTYYAPDAAALLADAFAEKHCFRVQPADSAHVGLVGLGFEPARTNRMVDVRGVLWLDPVSGALRALEFWYTNTPGNVAERHLGGRLDFQRLANGMSVVRRWELRFPLRAANHSALGPAAPGLPRDRVVALREAGGEVSRVETLDGRLLLSAALPAALTGVVFDSLHGAPLAGASVFLAHTIRTTVADSLGRFRFDSLVPGRYTVGFTTPELDSLGIAAPALTVELHDGELRALDLGVPSISTMLARLCPGLRDSTSLDAAASLVFGTVRSATAGAPVAGAAVTLSWIAWSVDQRTLKRASHQLSALSDPSGTYRACGIPGGASVAVRASRDGARTGLVTVPVPVGGIARRDFLLDVSAADEDDAAARRTAVLDGQVTMESGAPIASAEARLIGTQRTTLTDSLGRFHLSALPGGTQVLELRRVGFAPLQRIVDLSLTLDNQVRVVLERGVTTLDSVRVLARDRGDPLGFLERERHNPGGYFFDHRRIDSLATVKLSDVLRMTPGVIVTGEDSVQMRRAQYNTIQGAGLCPPLYIVDGMIYEGGINDFRPGQIEAMEVYPGSSSVPIQFGGARASCGAIVLWTRLPLSTDP